MVCGFWTHYQPPFLWLGSFSQLTWILLFFLFVLFFFPIYLQYFYAAKRTEFKIWAVVGVRKDKIPPEIGDAIMGDSPLNGSSKFLKFWIIGARRIKFSEWVDIKNELNLTKIGLTQSGLIVPKNNNAGHR